MITVKEAKQLVLENIKRLSPITKKLSKSLNHYLAEDIVSQVSIPLFNQSAMDGYAFQFKGKNYPLKVIGQIPAGDTKNISLQAGEAVRIFTGSKVPGNCDTVVMQELTEIKNNRLFVKDELLKLGGNIRKKGNQIEPGDIVLKKGHLINPGAIGLLSGMGIQNITVYPNPNVAIITTGNELIKPGNPLKEGQIYESNSFMLEAALNNLGIAPTITSIKDTEKDTFNALKSAIKANDLVIVSGGISVGDYDFVKSSLDKNNVNEIFYKVKQKPGKPLYFGKTENTAIFALPGNPAAALNCFYQYVLTAIKIMVGSSQPELSQIDLPLNETYVKKAGRANFLKAFTDFKSVTPLDGQASDALQAFALSNCLIFLPEGSTTVNKGEIVKTYLLPQ